MRVLSHSYCWRAFFVIQLCLLLMVSFVLHNRSMYPSQPNGSSVVSLNSYCPCSDGVLRDELNIPGARLKRSPRRNDTPTGGRIPDETKPHAVVLKKEVGKEKKNDSVVVQQKKKEKPSREAPKPIFNHIYVTRRGPPVYADPKRLLRETEKTVASLEDVRPDEHLRVNNSFFVPRSKAINSFAPGLLLQSSPCPKNGPDLLLVVLSVDGHAKFRTAIRRTWASRAYGRSWPAGYEGLQSNHTLKVVFFLGVSSSAATDRSLAKEAETHGDIVRANFSDSYPNLSHKMAVVLQWVSSHCSGARHVLKVDEDTIVNVPLLLGVLDRVSANRSRYILGHRHLTREPPVLRHGKWAVSKETYPLSVFPRYVLGSAYVISGDAVKPLLYTAKRLPVVANEDAYVTGILAMTSHVSRLHSDRFALSDNLVTRVCKLFNDHVIAQTGYPRPALDEMWEITKSKHFCVKSIVLLDTL